MTNQNSKLNDLEKAIISAIAYFDIYNYPLTLCEIWKWLYINKSQISNPKSQNYNLKFKISDVQEILKNSKNLKKIIETKDGFYFLKGREKFVDLRFQKYKFAQPRWKKLKRIVTLLQIIPNVKMIAACNTMAINDIEPESDIDVFIIIKKNRIWLTRFLITLIVAALGQWRHKKRIANKICLSWYITDENLNLNWVLKKPYDILLTFWITLVCPILDRGVYNKFIKENQWVRDFLPNHIKYEPILFERKFSKIFILDILRRFLEKIFEGKLGNLVERWFKKIQILKMKKNFQSHIQKDNTDVVISDKMLKFHEIDRRTLIRGLFEKKIAQISQALD